MDRTADAAKPRVWLFEGRWDYVEEVVDAAEVGGDDMEGGEDGMGGATSSGGARSSWLSALM